MGGENQDACHPDSAYQRHDDDGHLAGFLSVQRHLGVCPASTVLRPECIAQAERQVGDGEVHDAPTTGECVEGTGL